MVLVPDREALTGFAMPSVPVVVLCQGTEQHFPLQAVITGGSVMSLRHGPAQGCHRPGVRASEGTGCWGKRDWEASPARFQGNGSRVMCRESCCHRWQSGKGGGKGGEWLLYGAVGYSSRGWSPKQAPARAGDGFG